MHPPRGQSPGSTTLPRSWQRRWRCRAAPSLRQRPEPENRGAAPNGGSESSSLSIPCSLRDRVFREDILDPFERLLRRRFRLHSLFHYVHPADAPDVLVANLGVSRV